VSRLDILSRFKSAAAPGAASQAGVPADRAAQLAAELEPVLEMLAKTRERCAAIAADGELEAARIARRAADRAAAIASEGSERAAAARDAAAEQVMSAAQAQVAAELSAAVGSARSRRRPDEADMVALIRLAVGLVTGS
jgi:hypothetical protein